MAQIGKIALVTINGKGIPANPDGTELELGGYEREAVPADLDPIAGFDKTPVPSKLTFQPIARADFDPLELNELEDSEILIEYDSGYSVKMPKATNTKPGTKSGQDKHWSFEFMGAKCEKV